VPISSNGIMTSCHYGVTKVVILGIEYRYRSLSSIEVSSIDVIAGIVLTLLLFHLSTHFLRRPSTDIFKTFPHDVASAPKEPLL